MVSSDKGSSRFFQIACAVLVGSFFKDLWLCPHSKVEESFQLQATHDLIYYGISPAIRSVLMTESASLPYDHLVFPGVVPRTFAGPFLLATLCHVTRWICLPFFDLYTTDPMKVQFFVRLLLLLFSTHGWIRFAKAADHKLSSSRFPHVGAWLLLVTACQFHIPFYASRMLPNSFALVVVLHSYTAWVLGDVPVSASLMVFGTAIFRCDLLLLLGCTGLCWLICKQLTIIRALKIGIGTGVVSLMCTVPVDSLLWQRFLWPEGEVFYYNTILGKSSNWGTSAWHWYFSSALPKGMLLTAVLVPFSFLCIPEILVYYERSWRYGTSGSVRPKMVDPAIFQYLIPTLGFVILYSFLGHKETRFIFPAIPILNFAAAVGLSRLQFSCSSNKEKKVTWIGRLVFACGIFAIVATFVGSIAFVLVSSLNYPGGDALQRLTEIAREKSSDMVNNDSETISVHVDVAAAMSGVSLFGQRALQHRFPGNHWEVLKGGYEHENDFHDFSGFQYILTEKAYLSPQHKQVAAIRGNPLIDFRRMRITTSDSIYILERISKEMDQ